MTPKGKTPIFILSGKSPIEASGGGYSSFAYNLAKTVKKMGHPTYIIALGNETKQVETKAGTLVLFKASIPLLNVNIYALPGLPLYSIIFAKGIQNIVNKNKYDKFVVWGIGPWGLAGSLLKMFSKQKVIHLNNYFTTIRHEWWGGVKALKIRDYGLWPKLKYLIIYATAVQYLAILEKVTLKYVDKIITNYQSTEEILHNEFHIANKKFIRIRSYIQTYKRKNIEVLKNKRFSTPSKYLFFFSRQDPRKGVNFLLRTIKILLEDGYKIPLVIAGGGDMLNQNKRLAKKLKIEKYVKFLGFVNNPETLMKKCLVFIFPSIEEGSSALTINEVMQVGIPIVSTACDGIIEDIDNGKSGILVPKEDTIAMASAIEFILDNPKYARKLAEGAKKHYKRKFNLKYMEQDINKLLQNI